MKEKTTHTKYLMVKRPHVHLLAQRQNCTINRIREKYKGKIDEKGFVDITVKINHKG